MKKNPLVIAAAIVFYLFAGLLAAYAVWAFIKCMDVVSQAMAQGLTFQDNAYDIVNFFVASCCMYFALALLLAAAGYLIQRGSVKVSAGTPPAETVAGKENDAELDEWFQEADEESGEPEDEADWEADGDEIEAAAPDDDDRNE